MMLHQESKERRTVSMDKPDRSFRAIQRPLPRIGLLGSQQQSGGYLTALLRDSHVSHPGEGLIPSTRPAEFHYR